jgi:hypothetical protein
MATKPAKTGVEEDRPQEHRIRITLTSKNVKNLEKGEKRAFTAFSIIVLGSMNHAGGMQLQVRLSVV